MLACSSQKPRPCSLGEEGMSNCGSVKGLFILSPSSPPLMCLLCQCRTYGHNGMVSPSVKLLVLNWISPFAALQFLIFPLLVVVSDVVFHVTAPCYLSPASLCPACSIFLRHAQGFLFLSPLSGFLNVFLQALPLPFVPARAVYLHRVSK